MILTQEGGDAEGARVYWSRREAVPRATAPGP
jgi:hypothetical protein